MLRTINVKFSSLETTKIEAWDKMRGKVVRIYSEKGFGFIQGEDKRDYFMHFSAVAKAEWDNFVRCNKRGEEVVVEFTPSESDKGPRAEDVTRYA